MQKEYENRINQVQNLPALHQHASLRDEFMDYEEFSKLMCKSDKGFHHGYQRFYYPILINYQHQPIRFLEIGVDDGKSMNIWKKFFSQPNHIYGIGYKNYQTEFKTEIDDSMTIYMGDQSNTQFLKQFLQDSQGNFDFIIDDGSHVPSHVIISFETLWPFVKSGGYYIIEDIETSYWKKTASIYGYSLQNEGSVVEYFQNLVHEVNNEFRSKRDSGIGSISFMYNMIVIQKKGEKDTHFMDRPYRFRHFLP